MKELNKSDNQYGSLDPEKIYFVEKFGYLIKKINGGYGGPVQNALFDRINGAVSEFKTDLPNIVHDLEINRLKYISDQSTEKIKIYNRESKTKIDDSLKSEEKPIAINEKINSIQKNIADKIKAAPKIKSERLLERQTQYGDSDKSVKIEKRSTSLLKPSLAIIREQQRLKRIQAMEQKQESILVKNIKTSTIVKKPITTKPIPTKPITKHPIINQRQIAKEKKIPVQELTEWERKWHKYDGDIIGEDFKGYS